MGVINTAKIKEELEPGLNAVLGKSYKSYPAQWSEIFSTEKSSKAKEEEVMTSQLGLAQVKAEGASTAYDEMGERWVATYVHETISLGFIITKEAVEDNLYESASIRGARALGRSFAQTKEVKAAAILNNGFSSFTTGDGQYLFDTDHTSTVGNMANEPSVASQFSEAALEEALIDIGKYEDDRGLLIMAKPKKIVLPTELQFIAKRVLWSEKLPGTGDNDINPVVRVTPYVVNQFLTSATAWFIITDVPDGFKHFTRTAMERGMHGDFDTDNVKYKGRERYSYGVSDWRAGWGNPGA